MSEVAGRLAAQAGAYFLEKPLGGRGLLLGGVAGVAPGRCVVIGGGIVGYNAAVIAHRPGAQVTILERSIDRMRHLEEILSGARLAAHVVGAPDPGVGRDADVVIGAVLIPGALAPKLITREMVAGMKEGSVLADVAIDQGGCAETSQPTTHSDPVYVVDGVIALLRREHARRRADHVDEGAHERDAAVRRGDREPWPARGDRSATWRSHAASMCSTARSRTRPLPRRTISSTRRSSDALPLCRSEPSVSAPRVPPAVRSCE